MGHHKSIYLTCVIKSENSMFTARKRSLQRLCFTGVCLSTGGGHAWQGRGHAWQGVCMAGGVHGRGHVWQGGMHGRGHVWQGVCVVGGMCSGRACVVGEHVWQGMHTPLQILRYTINERAVSILLECILVEHNSRFWEEMATSKAYHV